MGHLSIAEVCDFLDWLEANHAYAEVIRPGVALRGLCGLQLQEALRLQVQHVDLAAGTITIEGEVKNRWRVRRLPVPQRVVEILRESIAGAPRKDTRIVRYVGVDWKAYSSLVEGSLDKWAGGKRPIAPKDLRNTLPTEATNGGWDGYFANRYLGHSPQTMAERHYHGEVSRKGANLIELLREHFVKWVDLLVLDCTEFHDRRKVVRLRRANNANSRKGRGLIEYKYYQVGRGDWI
ncbi:site-specific integrase [bacterium]|nr:site-specific integrase [bacterium]